MLHRHLAMKSFLTLMSVATLLSTTACTTEDEPLPAPANVTAQLGSDANQNGGEERTVMVSWDASSDTRVEGYAIYRAEQGIGEADGEKTEYKLQAITIATQYEDDELRTTERFPTTRYYYQVSVMGPEGAQGPMSEEISVDYQASE